MLGSSTRFLHDGWNLLAELNALNSNAVVSTYVWGSDLSGSSQGAGGVGGLLAVSLSNGATHAPAFDGNGNVIGLVDMATGIKSATYDYNAFGETIQSDGVASAVNHFRFSTKYQDDETGLYYYGFRYYQPTTGRWLNTDPIQESGGLNLYAMVLNNPTNYYDLFGLANQPPVPWHPPAGTPVGCTKCDTCPEISAKMALLATMISTHMIWDFTMPAPRGGNRHTEDIANLWRAYSNCQSLFLSKNCGNNPPPVVLPNPAKLPANQPGNNSAPFMNSPFMQGMAKATGLTGGALIAYVIISEGTRAFPPRNLVPVP